MKAEKLIAILEEYKDYDIDFILPNGDKVSIDKFWSFENDTTLNIIMKREDSDENI